MKAKVRGKPPLLLPDLDPVPEFSSGTVPDLDPCRQCSCRWCFVGLDRRCATGLSKQRRIVHGLPGGVLALSARRPANAAFSRRSSQLPPRRWPERVPTIHNNATRQNSICKFHKWRSAMRMVVAVVGVVADQATVLVLTGLRGPRGVGTVSSGRGVTPLMVDSSGHDKETR